MIYLKFLKNLKSFYIFHSKRNKNHQTIFMGNFFIIDVQNVLHDSAWRIFKSTTGGRMDLFFNKSRIWINTSNKVSPLIKQDL